MTNTNTIQYIKLKTFDEELAYPWRWEQSIPFIVGLLVVLAFLSIIKHVEDSQK